MAQDISPSKQSVTKKQNTKARIILKFKQIITYYPPILALFLIVLLTTTKNKTNSRNHQLHQVLPVQQDVLSVPSQEDEAR